jgi:hypothetical protein
MFVIRRVHLQRRIRPPVRPETTTMDLVFAYIDPGSGSLII